MHAIQQLLQFGQVLAMYQCFNKIMTRAFLTAHQIFDKLVPMQQLDHPIELCFITGTFFLLVGHTRFRGKI
jgi:hypothetical protein